MDLENVILENYKVEMLSFACHPIGHPTVIVSSHASLAPSACQLPGTIIWLFLCLFPGLANHVEDNAQSQWENRMSLDGSQDNSLKEQTPCHTFLRVHHLLPADSMQNKTERMQRTVRNRHTEARTNGQTDWQTIEKIARFNREHTARLMQLHNCAYTNQSDNDSILFYSKPINIPKIFLRVGHSKWTWVNQTIVSTANTTCHQSSSSHHLSLDHSGRRIDTVDVVEEKKSPPVAISVTISALIIDWRKEASHRDKMN